METRFCEYGQIETVQHYILECPLYDEARFTLSKRLREQLGIQEPNIYTLLGYDSSVEFPNWRELVCEEVGHYIEKTERFKETQDQILASQYLFFPVSFLYITVNWRIITREKTPKLNFLPLEKNT